MSFIEYHRPFVFECSDDPKHIYRGIKSVELKLLERIKGAGILVDFEVTDKTLVIGGREHILLKIPRVPYDVRIQDLTRKQAKRLLCDQVDLCVATLERGVCTSDISESNILYWCGKSYFVDLNAFSEVNSNKGLPFAYVKLSYLINKYLGGNNAISSTVYADHVTIKAYKDWTAQNWTPNQNLTLWKKYQQYVHNFVISKPKSTHWSDEYAHDEERLKENKKLNIVLDIIKQVRGGSVLDIGTNKGYYLDFINDHFDTLVGFDCDERCIDIAEERYGNNKTMFVKFSIEDCFGDSNANRAVRYRSDLVLALAVTHHFSTNNIDANKAAETICNMSKKHILIEDIANGGTYERSFIKNGFKLIDRRNSDPAGRKLSLWSRSNIK